MQGSVLGPLLFLLYMYINDLVDYCSNYSEVYIFASDAKIVRHIIQPNDIILLQHAIDALQFWFEIWMPSLNAKKCNICHMAEL